MTRKAAPPSPSPADLCAAAGRGDLAAVERALHGAPGISAEIAAALQAAAANGPLEAVALLHRHGADLPAQGSSAMRLAAANWHVAVVRYLHQNGADIGAVDGEVLRAAAAGRRADLIRYLHPNGVVHALLSQESRDRPQAMADEIRRAPPVYHPSRFWEAHIAAGDPLLTWGGDENFKAMPSAWFRARSGSAAAETVASMASLSGRWADPRPPGSRDSHKWRWTPGRKGCTIPLLRLGDPRRARRGCSLRRRPHASTRAWLPSPSPTGQMGTCGASAAGPPAAVTPSGRRCERGA